MLLDATGAPNDAAASHTTPNTPSTRIVLARCSTDTRETRSSDSGTSTSMHTTSSTAAISTTTVHTGPTESRNSPAAGPKVLQSVTGLNGRYSVA